MIKIDKAKVEYNDSDKRWQINFKVEIVEDYVDEYHIDSIKITNQDNYGLDNGWDTLYQYTDTPETEYEHIISEGDPITLLHVDDIGKDLMFIRVSLALNEGVEDPTIRCTSETTFIIATFNVKNIFDARIQHIKEINTCCEIPKEYIDNFLQYTAFKTALVTSNYVSAIKMYKKLMGNKHKSTNINSCGCGRIHR